MNDEKETTPELPVQDKDVDSQSAQEQMQHLQDKVKELEEKVKDKEDDDDEGGMWVIKLVLILIGVGVLWWLCPSNEKMEQKISQEVCLEYTQKFAHAFEADGLTEDLDRDDIDKDEALEYAERLGNIKVKSYGLVKLGYFKQKGRKKEQLAGIGICGFVITRSVAPSKN